MTPQRCTGSDRTDRPPFERIRRRPLLSALAGLVGLGGVASGQSDEADVFRVLSTTADAEVSYRFTVGGTVEKIRLDDEGVAADTDDRVFGTGDTTTVVGSTGDGAGDAYLLTGSIESFERTGGESGLRLLRDGEAVTDDFLGDSRLFRVLSTTDDAEVDYRFTVDGSVRKTQLGDDGVAADADDLVFDSGDTTSVDGSTGDESGDAYLLTGPIESFERTGGESGLRLFLDDENVTDRVSESG
ncbi:hypothetical protein NDI56_03325 [Haloarcula sp. S1CR25-12]|uniref:Uncharacterized protein n=1 Tax=Haloarcula saliterrae TaxID=2950534 RepID=A0ABU2F869_9EURY|nr:hypothetical protein [Haloarcula sp. S1CR25-12]MDS0258439.1 hypothetical protein [Haloarcula sp. S1CR25-12]